MEDATLQTAEQFREAIGVCAAEIVNLKRVQHAQGKLLKAQDKRIKDLTKIVGVVKVRMPKRKNLKLAPRPGGKPNA
jgi:hypothetical protein